MKHLSALFFVAALLAVTPARATCPHGGLVPSLLTPITSALPRDHGALVAGYRFEPAASTALSFEGVRLVRGRRVTIGLQSVPIAPGLSRLVPTTDLLVGRTPMPGAPVRPTMSAVRRVAVAGAATGVELRATLGFAVPTGIVAILSAWGDSDHPSVWSRAVVGQSDRIDLIAYRTLGRPELWWRIADANDALDPFALVVPGRVLRVPRPTP